jgi:hypothetical protein
MTDSNDRAVPLAAKEREELLAAQRDLAALAGPLHEACVRAWRATRPAWATGDHPDALVLEVAGLADGMIGDLTGVNGDYTRVTQPAWVTTERIALGLTPTEWDTLR